jgi:hypothetical protein
MAEVKDKDLKKIQKMMNDIISDMLYGGAGDPGISELTAATVCVQTLLLLGLKIKNEKDVRRELEGENVYDRNFLED